VALLEITNIAVLLVVLALQGQLSDLVAGCGDAHLMRFGVGSAVLKVGSSLVYQRALQLSPMSLSVPYLAFTPMVNPKPYTPNLKPQKPQTLNPCTYTLRPEPKTLKLKP
jgi:hypothetical protein